MSKIAIVADIHSNLPALEAVCKQIDSLGCRDIFCLGDVVGYGTEPAACIEIVRQRKMVCIQGNHDAHVADDGQGGDFGFNYAALRAVVHNRQNLNDDEIVFLKELPHRLNWNDSTLLVHGSPADRDHYLRYDADYREVATTLFEDEGPGLLFFGHTHIPLGHDGKAPLRAADGVFFVDPERRMLFNPGSVGQPRDGDARAAFMVWDVEDSTIALHRVQYDFEKARSGIIKAGLPYRLGDRLLRGR